MPRGVWRTSIDQHLRVPTLAKTKLQPQLRLDEASSILHLTWNWATRLISFCTRGVVSLIELFDECTGFNFNGRTVQYMGALILIKAPCVNMFVQVLCDVQVSFCVRVLLYSSIAPLNRFYSPAFQTSPLKSKRNIFCCHENCDRAHAMHLCGRRQHTSSRCVCVCACYIPT